MSQAIDFLSFGLILFGPEGAPIRANQWFREKTGLAETVDLDPAMDGVLAEVRVLARRCLEKGDDFARTRIMIENRGYIAEISRIQATGSKRGAICCIFPDIQEASVSDILFQTLQSQELDAIFKLSSDGILLCDGEGRVVKINEASERLNGWKAREVVGRNVRDLIREQLIDQSVTLHVIRNQKPVNMMQYIGRTQKHLLVTGTPLFGKDGRIKLVVVNERDMTQLNAIKLQLEDTRKVSEKYRDNLAELEALKSGNGFIKGESQAMAQVFQYAVKLARLEASNILVTGESGVGKGILARFIHEQSPRDGKPFIQINCAALPEGLLEAELFGYEKGAFTGAAAHGKAGLFELAHTGTLFLDEIGDCPLSIQAKLLKYLDDHEVLRLGGVQPRIIDCVIIAATNRELPPLIKSRQFRADLLYRLNTFSIHIPPLRERPADTFELIMHFLDVFNSRYGFKCKISSNALRELQNYSFPGNVRELKNIIKQAVVMSENDILDDFLLGGLGESGGKSVQTNDHQAGDLTLGEQMDLFERDILVRALSGSKSTREMARTLGMSQPTLVRRLKKYGLPPPSIQ